jgi:dienelactone hydrolase
MKTCIPLVALASALAFPEALPILAQNPGGQQIASILVGSGRRPLLRLGGGTNLSFKNYYSLFHLEISANLAEWAALATVIRTNAATTEVNFLDDPGADTPWRFYRTPSNIVVSPFLPPTGSNCVGTFSRMLTDNSRTNRFGIRTNSSFMLTFWYPAPPRPVGGAALARYSDPQIAERSAYWGAYTNRALAFETHARPDAPLPGGAERFPVVIYSHGLGDKEGRGARTENSEKAAELASHGFVVVALDHPETYATVLPPNQLIIGRNAWSFNFLPDRIKDVKFLLDYFAQLNAEDPFFKGRLDLDRIGIMGWSWGGGTSAEAARVEPRIKAAVLLDGYFGSPPLLTAGVGKPFLAMMASGGSADNTTIFNRATNSAYQLTIKGAGHETFTDNAWIINPTTNTRRLACTMNACLVSFFNKHLRGMDDGLLQNPVATCPDVTAFRKK